ncbi:hypothetical protein FNV43_RR14143 [Rhamnella rubrinervis]|uniref:Uncharacterized protein n=1 Tax=Rhamnella rubrinervis TaxID=2594499 RepID=A0A8K0H2A7_9ROSA|nr:hypothetical protein FNV43_RR14143 [Rhamnella rubrinervis]
MSFSKSCGILRRFFSTAASHSRPIGVRRFLNTAACDSKPIGCRRFLNTAAYDSKPIGFRRFLNTAAYDSKTIPDGSQQALSEVCNITEYDVGVNIAWMIFEFMVYSAVASTVWIWLNQSKTEARLDNLREEVLQGFLKDLQNSEADERWLKDGADAEGIYLALDPLGHENWLPKAKAVFTRSNTLPAMFDVVLAMLNSANAIFSCDQTQRTQCRLQWNSTHAISIAVMQYRSQWNLAQTISITVELDECNVQPW